MVDSPFGVLGAFGLQFGVGATAIDIGAELARAIVQMNCVNRH